MRERGMKTNRALAVTLLLAWGLCAGPAVGDTRLVMKETYTPGEEKTVEWWLTDKAVRRDEGPESLIFLLEERQLLRLNHRNQTYTVEPVLPSEGATPSENDNKGWKITPTDTVEKKAGWEARKVMLHVFPTRERPSLKAVIWLADVGFDTRAYDAMRRHLARSPGNEWLDAFDELEGFPVVEEIDFSEDGHPFQVLQELVTAKSDVVPPGTFAPPDGYLVRE
jgi:hypothetical protein